MEFMRRAKGSISIFLCIILMPMVTYSTMIIDASRMQVARTNIATAGDLAMNAALSEYEKVLQDMYGLFSVAQSEGDFEEQLKVYFTESLEGKFHSAEKDSKKYVEKGAELLTGAATKDKPADKIDNLTNLLLMSADELDYQTVPGSTLANQAIMKRQIIEYMKYKGPVSLATTLLPKLDFLKDSSKQTEVVKKKVEYTKTLDSLQGPCEEAWFKIVGVKNESGGYSVKGHQQLLEDFTKLQHTDKYMYGWIDTNQNVYIIGERTFTNVEGEYLAEVADKAYDMWDTHLMECTSRYYAKMIEAILLHMNSKVTTAETPELNWDSLETKTKEYKPVSDSAKDEATLTTYLKAAYEAFLDEINGTEGPFGKNISIAVRSTQEEYENTEWLDVVVSSDFITELTTYNAKFSNMYNASDASSIRIVTNDAAMINLKNYFRYQNDIRTKVEKEINDRKFQNVLSAEKNANEIKTKYKVALDRLYEPVVVLWDDKEDKRVDSETAYTTWVNAGNDLNDANEVLGKFSDDKYAEYTKKNILDDLNEAKDNKEITKEFLDKAERILYPLYDDDTKETIFDYYNNAEISAHSDYDKKESAYTEALTKYTEADAKFREYKWKYQIMEEAMTGPFWTSYKENGKTLFSNVSPPKGLYMVDGDELGKIGIWETGSGDYDSYFLAYAQWYAKNAINGWEDYITALDAVSKNCGEILTALGKVEAAIVKTNEAKAAWSGSIDGLSEGVTKSSMKSDMDSTTDSLSLEEVQTFIGRVQTIKDSVDKRISIIKEDVKLFDIPIMNNPTAKEVYNSEKAKTLLKKYNDDDPTVKIEDDAGTIIWNNLYCENQANYVFNNGNDIIEDDCEYTIEAIDGDPKDSEKFYDTLKSICETKKPEMTTEQQTQIDNINDSAQGNKPDDSGISPTSPADAAEPTEDPKDQEYSDEVKAIDIGAIYTEIKGVASENGFPDPTEDPNNTGEPSVNGMKIDTDKSKYNDKDDKKGKASEGQDSLDAGTSILSSIGDLGGKIVDCAYLEEYFTEMFTCRTDRESNGDIILLNGYAIPAPGEASLRTVNRNTPWFGKEIEYIIWGDSDLKGNWAKTDALIYTIRFALNAIYAFTAQDIQIFAAQVATAIAGWTVIGVPIVQACVTLAIAAAESAYDLVLLHQGKDVAIYKNATTFVCSPTGMVSKIGKEIATEMIEEAAEKTAEAIDNKIDEISNMANDKIEEKRKAALDYVAEYTKEQANQINTTVANMSVVPLMNALMPIATDFDNTANATVDQIEEDLKKAVDAAFEAITESISDMPDDSIVGTVAGYVYTEELKDKLTDEVIKHFNENVNPENYSAVDKLYSLKDYLIDDEIGESEPNGVISKAIYNKKKEITDLLDEKSGELTQKIIDLKDEQIGNLKNILHEGIDDMSGKITGTVTKSLEGAAENLKLDKVKDASASTGFTLNYKEYCKIFVLVKLAAGQEPKMLNRAAALIEANVKTANGVNNPEFQIINAYTLVSIKSKVRMGTLFPWGVAVEDASGTTGSVDLSLDMENLGENFVTINYQAVNGY